jgi:hypothetical protein
MASSFSFFCKPVTSGLEIILQGSTLSNFNSRFLTVTAYTVCPEALIGLPWAVFTHVRMKARVRVSKVRKMIILEVNFSQLRVNCVLKDACGVK